ncbi:hypothetical protein PIB30_073854 [Stylosanthes scabra]|uniref:Uncharacterized protein n=1 Tax=Stylosanthes scabra TaxID=79078 RepID=A0ABU6YNX6_9FABA|nr:hypothetical protein [Stylosanthes scabra]
MRKRGTPCRHAVNKMCCFEFALMRAREYRVRAHESWAEMFPKRSQGYARMHEGTVRSCGALFSTSWHPLVNHFLLMPSLAFSMPFSIPKGLKCTSKYINAPSGMRSNKFLPLLRQGKQGKFTNNPPKPRLNHVLTWAKHGSFKEEGSLPPSTISHVLAQPKRDPNVRALSTTSPHHIKATFESRLAKPKREVAHQDPKLSSQQARPRLDQVPDLA